MAKARKTRRHTTGSNTYRFFVSPETLHGQTFASDDAGLAHQLANVLRLQLGDHVQLLDNAGWEYTVALTALGRHSVSGVIERKELAGGEPRAKLALYVGLMRAERFEWVLQKGTELGVTSFTPLICERSTLADAGDLSEQKLERWNRVVREAAEQSRRAKLPRIMPALFFGAACDQAGRRGPALLLWEGDGVAPLRQTLQGIAEPSNQSVPFSIAIFSEPEGGLSAAELEAARGYGLAPVTLGPRTLRAETAPIVAATAILYHMGDLE